MKNQNLICTKCKKNRTIISFERLPKEVQIYFKKIMEAITEFKFQLVHCERCNESSIVNEYTNLD